MYKFTLAQLIVSPSQLNLKYMNNIFFKYWLILWYLDHTNLIITLNWYQIN